MLSEDCDATNSVWNTIEDSEIVVSVVSGDFSIEIENFVETNGKDCQNLSIVADILFGQDKIYFPDSDIYNAG